MISINPINVNHLFPQLNKELITLLEQTEDNNWYNSTVCTGWNVKDIVQHLLKDYLGVISRKRDKYKNPNLPEQRFNTNDELVSYINKMNQEWVDATKTLSPRLLIELLDCTGDMLFKYFETVDLDDVASGVSWISSERLPNWMDVVREYTEHWLHQAHLREGLKAPLLTTTELFHPFIETYLLALPKTYQNITAPKNTHIQIEVIGNAGGQWYLERLDGEWNFCEGNASEPVSNIEIDQDTLWRLFSKGMEKDEAKQKVKINGDIELGEVILNTVSLIA